jgi:hypothetical protein
MCPVELKINEELQMKWDYSKNPPNAWYVEDGDWVPVDTKLIRKCCGCENWFIEDPLKRSDYCSTGCKLKTIENKLKVN